MDESSGNIQHGRGSKIELRSMDEAEDPMSFQILVVDGRVKNCSKGEVS